MKRNMSSPNYRRQCSHRNQVVCECVSNSFCADCPSASPRGHKHKPVKFHDEPIDDKEDNELRELVDVLLKKAIGSQNGQTVEDDEKYISKVITRSSRIIEIINDSRKKIVAECREILKTKIKHSWYIHGKGLFKDNQQINLHPNVDIESFENIRFGCLTVQLDLPDPKDDIYGVPKLIFTIKDQVIKVPAGDIDPHETEFYVVIQFGGYIDRITLEKSDYCFKASPRSAVDIRNNNCREAHIMHPSKNHIFFSNAKLENGKKFTISLEVQLSPADRKYEVVDNKRREIPFIFGVTTCDPDKWDFGKGHLPYPQPVQNM